MIAKGSDQLQIDFDDSISGGGDSSNNSNQPDSCFRRKGSNGNHPIRPLVLPVVTTTSWPWTLFPLILLLPMMATWIPT